MAEPITVDEAKAQCRMVEDDSEDTFIESLIAPARAKVERDTRYFWVAATRSESFGAWGNYLEIHRRPIASIADAIVYTDEAGEDADYEGYLAPLGRYPLRIYPGIDSEFPGLGEGGRITVTYTSDALASTSEEYLIGKRAMLLLIGFWFENRGETPLTKDQQLAYEMALEDLRPVPAY